ncbi:glycoside hydrolase family 16 protein [Actinomadura hibisca]|uniref:glycoside hydrolase family 16 protein n=1 Tax=Actinomadura hibisca TaxID=68565 RepID=UPI0008361381|nr:glycoside hydrolase family 16 protein [Actinomadura hibisca]
MTPPARPTSQSRRRIWIAAGSVSGIIAATTVVGIVVLDNDAPERVSSTGAKADTLTPAAAKPNFTLPKARWKLSWHDEFNGRGKPSKAWTPLLGNGTNGWTHRALHYYQAGNVQQNGKGQLVISANKAGAGSNLKCWYGKCKYTSARVQTKGKFHQTYGRFAVRAKLPTGQGVWPAFWMQRTNRPYGEIDVVETIGSKPNLVQGYAHAHRKVGGGQVKLAKPLSAGYHTYGVDWTPHRVVWWVDGRPYAQMKAYRGWTFNAPFYLILNVQVGGNWPKSPNAQTRFPAQMAVDWVRVYKAG